MDDPFSFLNPNDLKVNAFPETSRYHGLGTTSLDNENGESITYLKRRFVPKPEKFDTLYEHQVDENERLDNLTAKYYNDPEQYWKICDANGVLKPNELVGTVGKTIRITLPEGIPGNNNG